VGVFRIVWPKEKWGKRARVKDALSGKKAKNSAAKFRGKRGESYQRASNLSVKGGKPENMRRWGGPRGQQNTQRKIVVTAPQGRLGNPSAKAGGSRNVRCL